MTTNATKDPEPDIKPGAVLRVVPDAAPEAVPGPVTEAVTGAMNQVAPEAVTEAVSEAVNEPAASKTQPGFAVPPTNPEPDLESRIKVRRAELIARLGELKVDLRQGASETRDKLKARLSELSHLLKWGIVDGWASVGDSVKHKLEHWLGDSKRQLGGQDGTARSEQS